MDNSVVIYRPRAINATLWAIQGVTAAMFLAAGISKLTGAAAMVAAFDLIGVGQWFRCFTGGLEIVAAVMLLSPAAATYGAAALAVTMVGAIVTHLFILGGSPAVPILLLASTALIAWTRWTR